MPPMARIVFHTTWLFMSTIFTVGMDQHDEDEWDGNKDEPDP